MASSFLYVLNGFDPRLTTVDNQPVLRKKLPMRLVAHSEYSRKEDRFRR
jgi:hypothetical protein